MNNTFSLKMLNALLQAKDRLSNEAREKIVLFVNSQISTNQAFVDKNGKEDLYYTSFGLMLTYVFRININIYLTEKWLDQFGNQLSNLVDYAAYTRCRMLCDLIKSGKMIFALNQFFAKNQALPVFSLYPHGDPHSPYSQFIILSLKEDMGIKLDNSSKIPDLLSEYRVEGGGFCNIKGSGLSSTNATVAALAVLGKLSGFDKNADISYLSSTQDECGGFYANTSAPVPDILSTATALFILKCYNVSPKIDPNSFIDAHWVTSGGFCATLLDELSDVEYTFYGLLAIGSNVNKT